MMRTLLVLFIGLLTGNICSAQTAAKPSANYNKEKTGIKTGISSLSVINTDDDFNKLARVFNKGTFNEIPHLLFTIDRRNNNKVYYINTPKYEFHLDFINYLLNRNYTPEDIKPNYTDDNRRFILGTVSYQNLISKYTYEFWEGDKITPDLLLTTQKAISESFNDTIIFKTNSTLNEELAKSLSISYVTQDQLVKEYPYIALNEGKTKGRIRIADSIESLLDINENDILVLKEVPISIPAVAGVITERASTLLSHVNMLARGLKIPSIYLKDASSIMQQYNDKYVDFKATQGNYTIKEIDEPLAVKSKRTNKYTLKSNLLKTELIPLSKMRKNDNIYCGVKAANLGEINAKIKDVIVPDGFSIPFAHYHSFIQQNKIYEKVKSFHNIPGFNEQAGIRRIELEKLRKEMESASINEEITKLWVEQWNNQLHGKGVFVRSSSNAEDLKNFSGAGLFTTVPNVKTAQELEKAVKTVWASVYNFEAYESRRRLNIPDSLIMMSVFVQLAANSDISGVMITKDPYTPLRWDITYIAAKRGIGIKVVEGKRIAEQVMFSEKTRAIQLISRSDENTELRLNPEGGVKEITIQNNNRVMSDELIAKLAGYGKKIKKLFNDDMDIEWAVADGDIIILQARPYQ